MHYPLQLSFKLIAIAPQLSIKDANGELFFYVKQKAFKLKEAVKVFADESQNNLLYEINADRVLDISAEYHFTDSNGFKVGSVKRHGMKSIWRSHYEIIDGYSQGMTVKEANPWAKVMDTIFSEIPILGMLSGYMFHPYYDVHTPDGTAVMRLKKVPSFFEKCYEIEKLASIDEQTEKRILLSLIMAVLLEKRRG